MYEWLGGLIAGYYSFAHELETWRVAFVESTWILQNALPTWLWGAIYALVVISVLAAHKIHELVPYATEEYLSDERSIEEAIKFTLKNMGLPQTIEHEPPTVSFVEDPTGVYFYGESEMNGDYDDYWGAYLPEWNRVFLISRRVDIWYHEIVHHVQRAYQNTDILNDAGDDEVMILLRKYLRARYPLNYWALVIPFGPFGLWGASFAHEKVLIPEELTY